MNPKLIDHHMHTNYSPDADPKATFKAYIDQAKKMGIERLIFTDHVDFDSIADIFDELIDYDRYIKDLNEIAKNEQFNVSLGVELGYQPHLKERNKAFTLKYPFEFVISSIHFCDGLDLYNGDFFKGKTQK
jgi:histidinol-phosphatase (PHP family)